MFLNSSRGNFFCRIGITCTDHILLDQTPWREFWIVHPTGRSEIVPRRPLTPFQPVAYP
ncbi:Hypothetical protein PAS_chr1-4_0240 [Komagataella phaffii GS115]|uniref:Uncharacterized protein n=1 Tax=Komagataella phaffii (strain GS115 / ATCC 20864) TaxID=644223 RepID=C4QXV2_KOMPG|nr:Hypothetical protein PAS_chr1-4_0240 [Komagataella phaffii GS115]CAY68075.1 Hypothetical protein PAS_chr1-4_0240 [Komagataella phaffii GS115]